jgi:hypothetical protein
VELLREMEMSEGKTETRALFWLGREGGESAGRDLRRAVEEGVILPEDYETTVSGCRSCGDPEVCKAWLAANDPARPEGCRNAPLIAELRAK